MSVESADVRGTVHAATLCAFAMIANQIASKAVRDALFLSNYDVELLPRMVIVSAVVSVIVVLIASRLLRSRGPASLVPPALALSSVFLVLIAVLNARFPSLAAIALYLHVTVFAAILVSWFWSLLNEEFDARSARSHVSRIAAGGTLGGLMGGLLAERMGVLASPGAMLPVLAGLHAVSAWMATRIGRRSGTRNGTRDAPMESADDLDQNESMSGIEALKRSPYLQNLAVLVFLGTFAAACLDFVFKSLATQTYADPQSLLRFFAGFYTLSALLAFAAQTVVVPRLMKTPQDLTRNVAVLPIVVLVGSTVAFLLPSLAVVAVARGLENVARNSFFRSSYEIFFNPISPKQKRSSKLIIDVGFDRLGDLAGGLLIQVIVTSVGVAAGIPYLLAFTFAVAGLTVWRIRKLESGYIRSLEEVIRALLPPRTSAADHKAMTHQFLLSELTAVQPSLLAWATTHSSPIESGGGEVVLPLDLTSRMSWAGDNQDGQAELTVAHAEHPEVDRSDDTRSAHLRSRDILRIRVALSETTPMSAAMVREVIQLLAWDAVHGDVVATLSREVGDHVDSLVAALGDVATDFTIRRRLPAVLVAQESQVAVDALLSALHDPRFDVRYQAGLALARSHRRHSNLLIDHDSVHRVIATEARVDRKVWDNRKILDDDTSEDAPFYRDLLDKRSQKSLEHLFHLLSLTFPLKPLRVAYEGLHTGDPLMRATSLEYLESILPPALRRSLDPILGDQAPGVGARTPQEALESLLLSHSSILVQLQDLKKHDP